MSDEDDILYSILVLALSIVFYFYLLFVLML